MPYQGLIAETVNINRREGDKIDAYLARWALGPIQETMLG